MTPGAIRRADARRGSGGRSVAHRTRSVRSQLGALTTACAVTGLLGVTACTAQVPPGTPPIPTFPGPGAASSTSAPPPRSGLLPSDCNQVLSADALPNLLGLPLGSAKVSALRDVPAPSAGRLERVTCTYTSQGGPGAPPGGTSLLKILASGYTTPQAAQEQARVNQQVETQSGVAAQPVPFGAAQASYYDDSDGPLLVVVYGRIAASFTADRGGVIPADQARATLTDLAQRALPNLAPPGS